MGAVWGPLVLVTWHWIDMGVSIGWEPDSSLRGAVCGPGREDFIDGPLWMWWQCWGEVPKLTCMEGTWWGRLSWALKEWLEVWL